MVIDLQRQLHLCLCLVFRAFLSKQMQLLKLNEFFMLHEKKSNCLIQYSKITSVLFSLICFGSVAFNDEVMPHDVVSTSIRRLYDVTDVGWKSYKRWNDVVCLLGYCGFAWLVGARVCSVKKMFFKISQNSQSFLKKSLRHRCSPVDFKYF